MTPEGRVVRAVTRLLKARGAWQANVTVANRRGVPDLLVCYRGRFVAIECKAPDRGVLSALQAYELDSLQRAGALTVVARSADEVARILDIIDQEHNT